MNATPAFAVRLDAALKVRPFISTDETRYYLQGVHISASPTGGANCAATDGHRLGIAFDCDGLVHKEAIVRIPAIVKAKKGLLLRPWLVGMMDSPTSGYIAIVDGKKTDESEDVAEYAIARVEECSLRLGRMFIDGTYPDWRGIIPEMKPTDTTRAFNRKYLAGFGDNIQITEASEASPHIVHTDDKNFLGVLMPMRTDRRVMPEWLSPPQSQAA